MKRMPIFKLHNLITAEQQRADLPENSQQTEVSPFTHVSCDFMEQMMFRWLLDVRKERKGFFQSYACVSPSKHYMCNLQQDIELIIF